MLKKFRKSRKGFTMVELMVVIVIMAVLGLAIMPSLIGSSDKAKYSRAWSDLNAITNAFIGYYGKQGTIGTITPGDLQGALGTADLDILQSFLNTPLGTKTAPTLKDPWGNMYQVAGTWKSDTGKGYIIVYVKPATGGTGDATTVTFRTGVTCSAKKDPYQNDLGMAKLVIDVM